MGDLQPLPSSLREKHRYIIVDITTEDAPELGAFVDAAWSAMLDLLGEDGTARADPWIVKDLYDEDAGKAGIRVHKDSVDAVRAALALITTISGTDAALHVVGVTGTMKSAREKYLSE